MTNYEMTEKLSEKMGVTMEDAKAALEATSRYLARDLVVLIASADDVERYTAEYEGG